MKSVRIMNVVILVQKIIVFSFANQIIFHYYFGNKQFLYNIYYYCSLNQKYYFFSIKICYSKEEGFKNNFTQLLR